MKKINYFVFLIMASCFLIACGKSNDATLNPQSTTVKGDLGDYFTVVEKNYVAKYDETYGNYTISIELQRTDKPFAFDTEGVEPVGYSGSGVYGNFGIGLTVFDADDNLAIKWNATDAGLSGVYSSDDLKSLMNLKSGETTFIRWQTDELSNFEDKNFTFEITSYLALYSRTETTSYNGNEWTRAMRQAEAEWNDAMREAEEEWNDAMREAEEELERAGW